MEKQKLRITAKSERRAKFSVHFMGVKLAVGFGRDSGAKIGYNARLISGDISTGGSRANWVVIVDAGSVFEIEVDKEFYTKNKNRIREWDMQEIDNFTVSKERADEIVRMANNLE